jgi:YD repeat-containing protein
VTDTSYVRILRYATSGNQVTATGRLSSVVDVRGNTLSFAYNSAGQLAHVSYPGSVLDSVVYDAEGHVLRQQVTTSGAAFIADTLTYDPMGRILSDRGLAIHTGNHLAIDLAYTGLGAVAASSHSAGSTPQTEEFRVDGLGRVYWSRQYHLHLGGGFDEPAIRLRPYNAKGQLVAVTTADTGRQTGEDDHHYWYDNEGRTTFHTYELTASPTAVTQEAHYYDGGGHLVQLERHNGWFGNTDNANDPAQVIESYRYDALGRRVLVHTHMDSAPLVEVGNSYYSQRSMGKPGTRSKCASRVARVNSCWRASAAIQRSFSGMGVPRVRSTALSSPYTEAVSASQAKIGTVTANSAIR